MACGAEDESAGAPEVPSDAIAVVAEARGCETSDGATCVITKDQFDQAIQQAAIRQGMQQVPASDDPQYEHLRRVAVNDLLLAAWVRGEAAERGIEVSDREIDAELQSVIIESFGSQEAFDRFLEQSNLTEEEARAQIELQLISQRIQNEVLSASGTPKELAQRFSSEFRAHGGVRQLRFRDRDLGLSSQRRGAQPVDLERCGHLPRGFLANLHRSEQRGV